MTPIASAARGAFAIVVSTTWLFSPAHAQVEIPSPYLDWAASFEDSAAQTGPVPRWNVNACTNAYEIQRKLDGLDGLKERTREIVDNNIYATEADKNQAHADASASLQDDINLLLVEAETAMTVLPYCNGLYLRSELEISCPDEPDDWIGICAALGGRSPDNVMVTENEPEFRIALARQFLGELVERSDITRVSHFAIGRQRMWFEGPACGNEGEASDDQPTSDSDRRLAAWVSAQDRIAKEAFGLYSLGRMGAEPACDELVKTGDWAFGFRTELFDQGGYSAEDLLIDPKTLAAAKLDPRVGPFWQQPRLEINLGMPPILLLKQEARLHVEWEDGQQTALSAAAQQLDPDHVASYNDESNRSSWFSFYPEITDWQALRNPSAAFLVATVIVVGPDGSEHMLELRSPLDGFAVAQDRFAAKRQEISDQYDAAIAVLDGQQ